MYAPTAAIMFAVTSIEARSLIINIDLCLVEKFRVFQCLPFGNVQTLDELVSLALGFCLLGLGCYLTFKGGGCRCLAVGGHSTHRIDSLANCLVVKGRAHECIESLRIAEKLTMLLGVVTITTADLGVLGWVLDWSLLNRWIAP